jgi:hypothetical protein
MTRQALSLRAGAWLLGLGPVLWPSPAAAQHVALEADGSILYVNTYGPTVPIGVFRIDPVTGAATPLSTDTAGSGPAFAAPRGIAIEAGGTIVVGDGLGSFNEPDRILRVDPASGARTIVSDATTGTGPVLTGPYGLSVGADGGIYVTDGDSVLRADPFSGDRSVVSSATVGTGPSLDGPAGIAFENDGNLVVSLVSSISRTGTILRIDPATGDRTTVSDKDTGGGPRLRIAWGLEVGPKGKIAAVESPGEPTLCIPFCPNPLCLACLFPAAALVKVDPESGNRRKVSGGGSCVFSIGGGCETPYFGAKGDGPSMLDATDLAREAADTYVMSFSDDDGRQGVMRVNPATHERTMVVDLRHPPAPIADGVARRAAIVKDLAARHPERICQPADTQAWLRHALGNKYARLAAHGPQALFDGLSPAERRVVVKRLYDALQETLLRVAP